MSKRFTKIKQDTFQNLQLGTGVLLNSFDVENPALSDSQIICATTGGIAINVVPEYLDHGEDIDNAPKGTMELKEVIDWECSLEVTCLDVTAEMIARALGPSTITSNKITPSSAIKLEDFKEVWWVGDKGNGEAIAVLLKNAMSQDGFSLQTENKNKGQLTINLKGHFSLVAQDEIPVEFYIIPKETA